MSNSVEIISEVFVALPAGWIINYGGKGTEYGHVAGVLTRKIKYADDEVGSESQYAAWIDGWIEPVDGEHVSFVGEKKALEYVSGGF